MFKILDCDDPILNTPTVPFTGTVEDLKVLKSQLSQAMLSHNGIGLAANQVGLSWSIFVFGRREFDRPVTLVVNPEPYEIIDPAKVCMKEGCLSAQFGEETYTVHRPSKISVSYKNENLENVTEVLTGMMARCYIHEYEHLLGLNFRRFKKKKSKLRKL